MEPQPPTPEVTVDRSKAPVVVVWLAVLLVAILGALAVGFYLGVGTSLSSPSTVVSDQASSTVPTETEVVSRPGLQLVADMPSSTVASLVANISFNLPEGWYDITSAKDEQLPAFLAEYSILLKDSTHDCVAAFGRLVPERGVYVQASFATRVFDKHNQHDGNWFAPMVNTPVVFSEFERQYRAGEYLRYNSSSYQDDFILWAGRDRSVPDACVNDVQEILTSIDYYYPPFPETRPPQGVLGVKRPYSSAKSVIADAVPTVLTISEPDTMATHAYVFMPAGTMWYSDLFVSDNKIHSFARTAGSLSEYGSALIAVDVAKRTVDEIPVSWYVDEATVILSHYVVGGRTYLTVVPYSQSYCMDKGACNPDLLVYNHAAGTVSLVREKVSGGEIIGFDSDAAELYLRGGWGDAGCATEEIFVLRGDALETLLDVSYCFEDTDSPPGYETAKAVREFVSARIEDDRAISPTAYLENGTIRGDDRLSHRSSSQFIFTQ